MYQDLLASLKDTKMSSVYQLLRGLCGVWLMERKLDQMNISHMMDKHNVETQAQFKRDSISEEIELEFKEFSNCEDRLQDNPTHKGISRRPQDEGY